MRADTQHEVTPLALCVSAQVLMVLMSGRPGHTAIFYFYSSGRRLLIAPVAPVFARASLATRSKIAPATLQRSYSVPLSAMAVSCLSRLSLARFAIAMPTGTLAALAYDLRSASASMIGTALSIQARYSAWSLNSRVCTSYLLADFPECRSRIETPT
jgi:hypothetical protein